MNALPETLGIVLTVSLVDYTNRRREESRLLPQRIWAYNDMVQALSEIFDFWKMLYFHSGQQRELTISVENPLSQSTVVLIADRLILENKPPMAWYKDWWECIPEESRLYEHHFEQLLLRHQSVLDPVAAARINRILSTYFSRENHLASITREQRYTNLNGGSLPKSLADCWPCAASKQSFSAVHDFYLWCRQERDSLIKLGVEANDLKIAGDQ